MNVLVSSISKKVPLIKTIKKALNNFNKNGLLIGGDCDETCIGRYFVDDFWHMPKQEKLKTEEIITWCKKNKVSYIIPTRDGELIFWSKIKKDLLKENIHVMISEEASLKICQDKELFFKFLSQQGFPVIPTSSSILDISGDYFVVKEKTGAGSHNIGLNLNKKEAKEHAKKLKSPLFQPFIKGKEYTVDLYIGKDEKILGCIARKRLLIDSGESQITETEKNLILENLCGSLALKIGLRGHVLFQVIKKNKTFHIIECNPRFGGASTLSVEAGLDSFSWFFSEASNSKSIPFKRTKDEITMVRHAEDFYFRF